MKMRPRTWIVAASLSLFSLIRPCDLWAATDPVKKLADDLSKSLDQFSDKKIAVLSIPHHDNRRSLLSETVPDKLTTYLADDKKLSVLDRHHIQQVLDELHMSETGLVDLQSAKTIGHVLGADILITGTLINLDDGQTEANLRAFLVDSGRIVAAARTMKSDPLKALAKKLKPASDPKKPVSLAVLDFTYPKGRLSTGSFLVSERLLTYLVQEGQPMVERRLLEKLYEEKKLSESGLMAPSTTDAMGKIQQVDGLVTGSLEDTDENSTKVLARVIEIETTKILTSGSVTIPRLWSDVPRVPRFLQTCTPVPVLLPSLAQTTEEDLAGTHRLNELEPAGKKKRYVPAVIPYFSSRMEARNPL